MKLLDKLLESMKLFEDDANTWLELTTLGSILNMLENGINEFDEDIQLKFKELHELVIDKRNKIGEKEVSDE